MGKSELIKQVLRESDIPGIYYECKQTSEMNNVESLAVLIADEFHLPRPAFANMEEVLDFLFQKSCGEKLIFVLDEYSYLRDCVTGMDSILQSFIDKYSESSSIKLILCGSFVDVMKSLLYNENPLYGRVDLTINLKPMDYFESALTVRENITELIAFPGARLENEVSMYLKSEISKISKYYYADPVRKRNSEFDIVTKDAKGYIFMRRSFAKNR